MKKRFLSVFLALSMLFSTLPTSFMTTALADETDLSTSPVSYAKIDYDANGNITGVVVTPRTTGTGAHSGDGDIAVTVVYADSRLGIDMGDGNGWVPLDVSAIVSNDMVGANASYFNNGDGSQFMPSYRAVGTVTTSDSKGSLSTTETFENAFSLSGINGYLGDLLGTEGDYISSDDNTPYTAETFPSTISVMVYVASSVGTDSYVLAYPDTITVGKAGHIEIGGETGGPIAALKVAVPLPDVANSKSTTDTEYTKATLSDADPSAGVDTSDSAKPSVSWSPTGAFAYGTKYTATITIPPASSDYYFVDDAAVTADPSLTKTTITDPNSWDTVNWSIDGSGNAVVVLEYTPTQTLKTIETLDFTYTDIALGSVPSTSVTDIKAYADSDSTGGVIADVTADVTGVDVIASGSAAGNVQAGTNDYVITFDVTAPSGYKFDHTVSVTGANSTGNGAVSVNVSNDDSKATVTITYDAIAREIFSWDVTPKNTSTTVNVGASYTIPSSLKVDVTYNDGYSESITNANFGSDWEVLMGTDTSSASVYSGATLSASNDGDSLYVHYAGSSLASGVNAYKSFDSIDINVPLIDITSAKVKVTAPVPGASPSNSATVDETGAHYSIDTDTGVAWYEGTSAGGTVPTSFEYGKSYTVLIPLSPEDGYQFTSSATAQVNSQSAGTITSNAITYTFSPMTAPTITSIDDYDYYNGGNAVTIQLSGDAVGVTSITIGGETVTGTLDTSDKSKINITAANFKTLVEAVENSGSALTAPFAAKNYNVSLVLTGMASGSSATSTVSVKNTTPYVRLLSGSDSLTSSPSVTLSAGTYVPVTKASYTFTAPKGSHYNGTDWTGSTNGTQGTGTDTNTYTIDFTAGSIQADIKAVVDNDAGQTLTITQPSNAAITVTGPSGNVATGATIYGDEQYTVTITANSHYKAKSASGITFSGSGGITTVTNYTVNPSNDKVATYVFSPTGSGGITVTGSVDERDYLTFKFAVSDTGTYDSNYQTDATRKGGTISVDGSAITPSSYSLKVYDDDSTPHSYTQTPKADSKAASTLWTATTGFTPGTDTISGSTVASFISAGTFTSAGEITITANYVPKALPTITAGSDNQTRVQVGTPTALTYTLSDGDYTRGTVSATPSISGSWSGNDYTISSSTISSATAATYKLEFNYTDLPTGYLAAQLTRNFEIKAPGKVTSVGFTYADATVVHGTNISTFYFDYTPSGGTSTRYTYTSSSDSWSGTVPSEVRIKVNSGTEMTPAAFVSAYVHNNHVRYLANSTTGHLVNGDTVIAYANSETPPSANISVGRKPVNITATHTDLGKQYDGDAKVTDTLSWDDCSPSVFLSEDTVNAADITVSGTYQAYTTGGANYAAKDVAYAAGETNFVAAQAVDKTVNFTAAKTTANSVADNYTYTVTNTGSGKITPITLTITAITNIPDAKKNISSTKSKTDQTGTFPDNVTTTKSAVGSEKPGFTYDYTYASIAATADPYTSVSVSNIKSTDHNYVITPTSLSNQSGKVTDPGVYSVTVTNDPKLTYNYGAVVSGKADDVIDLTSMRVTVRYGTATEYEDVVYTFDETAGWKPPTASGYNDIAYANMPVTWTTGGAQVTHDTTKVEPKDHSTGETLTVTYEGKTANTSALTINTRALEIDSYTGSIYRDYDNTTAIDEDDGNLAFTFVSGKDILSADASDVTVKFTGTFTDDKNVKRNASGTVLGTKPVSISTITLDGAKAGNYSITTANGVTKANALNGGTGLTGQVNPINATISAITVPSISEGAPASALSDSETVVTNGKGSQTGGNGITVSGLLGIDKLSIDYTWTYTSSATAGSTSVTLSGVQLTDSTSEDNTNYTLTGTPTGTGNVIGRTLTGISYASGGQPTQADTQLTYGDQLDLSGVKLQISYDVNGTTEVDTYEWDAANSTASVNKWKYTPFGPTTPIDNSTAPFTFTWDGGSEPFDDDVLTVAQNNKGIKAGYTFKGVTKEATSTAFKVQPFTIDEIVIDGLASPYSVSKVYDSNDTVDTTGWSYTLNFAKVNNSDTVTLSTDDLTVKYNKKDVHSDENLKFAGWKLSADENGNYKLADTIKLENESGGTYTEITPKGSITQRYIKVTAVNGIQSIDEYAGDYNTTKNVTGENTATYAALDAADVATLLPGETVAVADTGIVNSEKPYIKYGYVYTRYTPATTSSDNQVVTVSNILFDDGTANAYATLNGNYKLFNTTITNHVGTINAVKPIDIEITAPSQMYKTGAAPDVQYMDTLTMTGLTVAVKYTATNTTTYTLQSDGKWVDDETTPTTYPADGTGLPFSFAWSGSTQYKTGDTLTDVGTFTYTATLSNPSASAVKDKDSANLTVGKRKVKVTASDTTDKVYDGTKTSDGNNITYGVAMGTTTGNESSGFTSISGIEVDTSAASFTYDSADVADNSTNKVTITGLKLKASTGSSEDPDNYVIDTSTGQTDNPLKVDGTIQKRKVKLTGITAAAIAEVGQYTPLTTAVGTDVQVTSKDNPAKTTFDDGDGGVTLYGLPSASAADAVKIQFDYAYNDTDTKPASDNVDITFSTNDVTYISNNNPNYDVELASGIQVTKEPKARTIKSIAITKLPKTFQSDAYYKDTLNIDEMEVTLTFDTSPATTAVYTASVSGTTVTWSTGGSAVTPPFTYGWKNTSASQTFAQGEELSVTKHNNNYILVTSNEKNKNGSSETDEKQVTVLPLPITTITATATGAITKEFDNKTALDNSGSTTNKDKLGFAYSYTRQGGTETALDATNDAADISALDGGINATLTYPDVNAEDNKALQFDSATISGAANFKLDSSPTLSTSLKGDITKKEVTITKLYVPTCYGSSSKTADITATKGNGTTKDTYDATGFISDDPNVSGITFGYTVTYDDADVTAATGNPVNVTITAHGGTGNSNSGKIYVYGTGYDNYTYVDDLTPQGIVTDDEVTAVEWISAPAATYTHGDRLNPLGMSINVKSTKSPGGITYTVYDKNGGSGTPDYAWTTDGGTTAATITIGAKVVIGDIDITDDLNVQAQYIAMGGSASSNETTGIPIKLLIDGTDTVKESDNKLTLKKRELEFTIKSVDKDGNAATITKQYDGSQSLPDGYSIVPDAFTTGKEIQTIGGTLDTVTITIAGQYKTNGDVTGTSPDYDKTISATSVTLSAKDANNYYVDGTNGLDSITTTNKELNGSLQPYKLKVTAIDSGVIDNTYYGVAKDNQTVTSTAKYTSNIDSDTVRSSLKPNITFNYSYGNLKDTIASPVDVPIDVDGSGNSTIALAAPSNNFVIDDEDLATTAPGAVLGDIDSITVTGDDIDKIYGDTLTAADLTSLKATITFADGTTTLSDVAYGSAAWTALSLSLDDTSKGLLDNVTILRTTDSDDNKIKVKKSGVTSSDGVKLTVAQRPILLDVNSASDLAMTYYGGQILVDQSTAEGIDSTTTKNVTLKLATESDGSTAFTGETYTADYSSANKTFYGLVSGDDAAAKLAIPAATFTFGDKNASASAKALNLSSALTLLGTNADQYAPELKKQEGTIGQRTLKVTPKVTRWQNTSAASPADDETVTETAVLDNVSGKVTVENLVSADAGTVTFKYKFKITGDKLVSDGTVTLTGAYDSDTTTRGITGDTNAVANYTVDWQDPVLTVEADTDASIKVTTDPTAMTDSTQEYYGDSLSLAGMEIVVKTQGVTYTYTHDGTDWKRSDTTGSTDVTANDEIIIKIKGHESGSLDKLYTAYNTELVAECTRLSGETDETSAKLNVKPRPLSVIGAYETDKTATDLNKTYDGTENVADGILKLVVDSAIEDTTPTNLGLYKAGETGADVFSYTNLSWDYYDADDDDNTDADVQNGKPVKHASGLNITIKDADGNDVTAEYAISDPTYDFKGNITPYQIVITVDTGTNKIPSVFKDSTDDGDLEKQLTISDISEKSGMPSSHPSDWNDVTSKLTAHIKYTTAQAANNDGTVINDLATYAKYDGGDIDNLTNYTVEIDPDKVDGKVIDNKITKIEITQNPSNFTGTTPHDYTHGDKLSLAGMKIYITNQKPDTDIELEKQAGSNDLWDVKVNGVADTPITTSNLPVALRFIETDSKTTFKDTTALTDANAQLRYSERYDAANSKTQSIIAIDPGDPTMRSEEEVVIPVGPKTITAVSTDYATKEGSADKYTMTDITKPYDGNGTIDADHQKMIAYTPKAEDIASFDDGTGTMVPDVVEITGTARYKSNERNNDGGAYYDADDNKAIEITGLELAPASSSNANADYVLKMTAPAPTSYLDVTLSSLYADANIPTSENVKGQITQQPLTYEVKSIPSVAVTTTGNGLIKDATVELKSGTIADGEETNFNPPVKAKYDNAATKSTSPEAFTVTNSAQEITDAQTAHENYVYVDATGAAAFPYKNYSFTLTGTPTGNITNMTVYDVALSTPLTVQHGDTLKLDGTVVTVKYADDDSNNYVYTYTPSTAAGEAGTPWVLVKNGDTAGATRVAAPDDVVLIWGSDADAAAPTVFAEGKVRADDTDKAITGNGPWTAKATVYAADDKTINDTDDVTITQKQLSLKLEGKVTKIYDGESALNSTENTSILNNPNNVLSGVDTADSGKVELDTVALSYTGTGANHAGVTTADTVTGKHPALTIGEITITGDNAKFYKAPAYSATAEENFVENNTEGEIKQRPIKITSITKNMNAAVGAATKTGTLHKLGESDTNTDGYTVTVDDNFKDILSGDKIWIKVTYTYDGDIDTEQPSGIDVVWTNPGLEDDPAELGADNNDDVANYDITYDIANSRAIISNGAVTSVIIEDGGQLIGYTHGDKIDMSDLAVTLIYDNDNGKSNKYVFNPVTGLWKLYRNGSTTAEAAEKNLADEGIKIKLGATEINTNPVVDTVTPANDTRTVVKYAHNGALLTAVYTGSATDVTSETDNPKFEVSRKTITVPVTSDGVSQPYAGADNKALTAENVAKIVLPDATAINAGIADGDDAVFAWTGNTSATFTNGNVKVDEEDPDRPAIAQEFKLDATSYTFTGDDIGSYIIEFAPLEGVIEPFEFEITKIDNIPPAKLSDSNTWSGKGVETASYVTDAELPDAGVPVKYDYTYDAPVDGEDNNHAVTVDPDTITIGGASQQTKDNYKVTYNGTSTGVVNEKTAKGIEILTQPKYVSDPTDGHPVHRDTLNDAGGLDGFKFKITYDEGGDETNEIYVYHDGAWNSADPDDPDDESKYTPLTQGLPADIQLTWDNTSSPMDPTASTILKGSEKNTITITSTSTADPDVKAQTTNVTAGKKLLKLTAAGTFAREYDGTDTIKLNAANPEITASVAPGQLAAGEDVTVTATPRFTDANVKKNEAGEYEHDIVFTNVSLGGADADNYDIEPFDNANDIEPIKGQITPKTLNVDVTDSGIRTSTNNTTVTRTGIAYTDEANKAGTYTIAGADADTKALIGKDNVTITYTGTYPDKTASTTPKTLTDITAAAEGENADNYKIVATVTGTVSSGGGGGGGGGGSSNSLTIHYKNEDGTAGDDVSKIEAQLGEEPADLIGVIKTKISDMTVIWSSDNEQVATVDENGVVTFVGEGTATITAVSKQTKSLKDTVVITVAAPEPTATPEPEATPTPVPTAKPSTGYEKTDSLITKDMLNPYIVGYDDYVFGPELPISREELAAIFARLIANNLYMDQDYATSFPDVPEKWSKSYIGYLEGFNVVTGYEDGMFRPENYITRAEMAVMMAKAEGYDLTGYVSPDEVEYADVDEGYSTWAATKAIKILTDEGIMQGYPDGTFRPGQPITRAETVATVNRVLSAQEVASYDVLPSDVTDAHWAYNDIVFAMNHRILKDAAADPNAFIWSEQFDENMVTVTERVEGEVTEVTNPASSEEDTSSDEAAADTSEDAIAPETTDTPTESDTAATN